MSGRSSSAVALFEFLLAAARAGIVATYVFECIAHRFLRLVVAVRAVDMAVVMMMVVVVVIVVAIRAMHMGLLVHRLLRDQIAGNYVAIAANTHAVSE